MIDDLISNFKTAKRRAEEQKAERKRREASERAATEVLLTNVALPVLDEIALKLGAEGFYAEASTRLADDPTWPAVELRFEITRSLYPSVITFGYGADGTISVTRRVMARETARQSHSSISLKELSQQSIYDEAGAFIASVLEAN